MKTSFILTAKPNTDQIVAGALEKCFSTTPASLPQRGMYKQVSRLLALPRVGGDFAPTYLPIFLGRRHCVLSQITRGS